MKAVTTGKRSAFSDFAQKDIDMMIVKIIHKKYLSL